MKKRLKLLLALLIVVPLTFIMAACEFTLGGECDKEHLDDYTCVGVCERDHCDDDDCEPPVGCEHDWVEWFVYQKATCTDDGIRIMQCETDNQHIKWEVIGALGTGSGCENFDAAVFNGGQATLECLDCEDITTRLMTRQEVFTEAMNNHGNFEVGASFTASYDENLIQLNYIQVMVDGYFSKGIGHHYDGESGQLIPMYYDFHDLYNGIRYESEDGIDWEPFHDSLMIYSIAHYILDPLFTAFDMEDLVKKEEGSNVWTLEEIPCICCGKGCSDGYGDEGDEDEDDYYCMYCFFCAIFGGGGEPQSFTLEITEEGVVITISGITSGTIDTGEDYEFVLMPLVFKIEIEFGNASLTPPIVA